MATARAPGLIHFPHPPSYYIGEALQITSTAKLLVILGVILVAGAAGTYYFKEVATKRVTACWVFGGIAGVVAAYLVFGDGLLAGGILIPTIGMAATGGLKEGES